jgi:hypothetical protein
VILSNYRGAHVSSLPKEAIPEVLVTLARSAHALGKLPASGPGAARAYLQLQQALDQLGQLADALAPETRGQRTTSGSPAAHRSPASPASCKLITERHGAFAEQGCKNRLIETSARPNLRGLTAHGDRRSGRSALLTRALISM